MTINDSMVYVYEISLSWGWRLGNILVYAVCFTQYSGESMSNLFEIIPHHLSFRFDPCFFIVLSRIYKTFHLIYRVSRFNSQQFHSIKLCFEQFNDSIQDPGKWPENWGGKAHIRPIHAISISIAMKSAISMSRLTILFFLFFFSFLHNSGNYSILHRIQGSSHNG